MSTTEWKKIKEEPARLGFRKIIRKTFVLPTGVEGVYDINDSGHGAVCGLALTEDNQVILCRQFRPGPEKILLEIPGGGMVPLNEDEPPMTPEQMMARELLEETGYAGEVEFVGTCYDDAYSNMFRHCFVIKNCKKIQEPQYEIYEHGEVVLMPLVDFRKHLRTGELTDVEVGYLCLDYLNLL